MIKNHQPSEMGLAFDVEPDDDYLRVDNLADVTLDTISKEVLLALLDWTPIQVLLKDASGKYLFLNRRIAKYLGDGKRDPLGTYDRDASDSAEQIRRWRDLEEECMRTRTILEDHVLWTDPEGRRHHNDVLNIPIADRQGTVLGVAVLAHDVIRKAEVKQSRHLLDLLRHDWVNGLLRMLISRIDNSAHSGVDAESLIPGLGYSLSELKIVFEFMESYLISLPSLMDGYPSKPRNDRQTNLVADVFEYMNRLSPLIGMRVQLSFDRRANIQLVADEDSLRVLCYEMMVNHTKYGEGDFLSIEVGDISSDRVRIAFISPGQTLDPQAYRIIGSEGRRFTEGDKNPKGSGKGLHFCRTLVLAHNRVVPDVPEEYRDKYYGTEFDAEKRANIFWYVLPRGGE